MPSVITDSSLSNQSGIVNNGASPSSDVWSYPDTPALSILNFQAVSTQPLPGGTTTATGMLSPDQMLAERLRNFYPGVYDLSPGSALVHFLESLLGDSGVGQLRKRQTVARLQEALTSTSFYDLDSFYGALFGDIRGPSGSLPVNPATGVTVSPYTDLGTSDGWDDVEAIDAKFRERIINLARAITLGATVPGLQALGEAVAGYKCHVYETWRVIDNEGPQAGQVSVLSWSQIMAQYATWNAFPASLTWNSLQGFTTTGTPAFGGLGINARSEVIVIPRKMYATTAAGQTEMSSDLYGIERVCEVLKPANTLLSVSTESQLIQTPVPIAALWADSEFWEITYDVSPPDLTDPAYAAALAGYQRGGQPVTSPLTVPSPPMCQGQGTQISYAADVTVSWAQASRPGQPAIPADVTNFETEMIGGQQVTYTAPKAVIDPVRAASARTASAVGLQAAPYSGPRVPAVLAG